MSDNSSLYFRLIVSFSTNTSLSSNSSSSLDKSPSVPSQGLCILVLVLVDTTPVPSASRPALITPLTVARSELSAPHGLQRHAVSNSNGAHERTLRQICQKQFFFSSKITQTWSSKAGFQLFTTTGTCVSAGNKYSYTMQMHKTATNK